jgi:SAM-dependent methyltransferase
MKPGANPMRPISELRGLRFPDEFVVKMFFKEKLNARPGRVIEFGCGSGNNLGLFLSFNWDVTGLDISPGALANARHNLNGIGRLVQCDLAKDFPDLGEDVFDAVLLPSVNYYLPRASFIRLLEECRSRTKPGALFYIRSRRPDDWRWGRGKQEGPGAFRLDCDETNELGLLNVFYSPEELRDLIREYFGMLREPQVLHITADVPMGKVVVRDADVVIWGKAAGDG